jgi:beta-lactamase class A
MDAIEKTNESTPYAPCNIAKAGDIMCGNGFYESGVHFLPGVRDIFMDTLARVPGKTSMYYKNLITGESFSYQPDLPLIAASLIKLPVMAESFRQLRDGETTEDAKFYIEAFHKLPSCGVLSYLRNGIEVTLMDLVTLMIIVSDNTATNLLVDFLGPDSINETLLTLGARNSRLNRRLFEPELSRRGIQNYITAGDMGRLLEKIYREEAISPEASRKMLHILSCQQLNGKIPFYLHSRGIRVAHKTGEDDGISHDTGIVFAKEPFVLCLCANEVDVPAFERLMQDAARMLADEQNHSEGRNLL